MAISLRPHQTDAIRRMRNGTILTGDVGTGKSITALAYYYTKVCNGVPNLKETTQARMKTPMDLYILTTAKKKRTFEWDDDAIHFNISRTKNPEGVTMHVESWNNIEKFADVKGAFFIFDEQRLVGSGAWVKAFLKIAQHNQWILLSATPGDTWMDFVPVMIANGYFKNRSEFIREHVVYSRFTKYAKVDRYVHTERLEKIRNELLIDMPYERHTIRKTTMRPVEYDKELFDRVIKDRWHVYEDRPIKGVAEMYQLLRKVVNSDMSRLGEIMKIAENHPRLIIFYNFNYELETLRTLAGTLNVEVGEWNGKRHDPVPEGDRWLYLVQYTAGSEGWNCITTDTMAFYSLTYSWRAFQQSKGRTDRLNTPYKELYYYILRSNSKIDEAIWRALMKKKNFNAKTWTEKLWATSEKPTIKTYEGTN